MRTPGALTLSLFLLYGTAFADTPKDADAPAMPAAPAKRKALKSEKSDANLAAEIEELRQAVQAQQEQLQLLKEELAKRDREINARREAAAAANAKATEANARASEAVNGSAELKSATSNLSMAMSDVKASNEMLKARVATEQETAKKAEETGPAAIRYKGISITPGGYIEAATISRQRAESADINTPFTGIPYPGQAIGKVSENNFTARQSRLSLLAETTVGTTKVTGYYEMDFLGAGTTSNNRQSNSYVMRQRQLWASAGFESGLTISAGQMWSLATETKKGIVNRTEMIPLTVDSQYQVGFSWQRAYGFRVAQNWNKFALGAAIEAPQYTIGGRGFPANFFINAPGNLGGLYNGFDPTGYSLNRSPDFLVKATADPGWGHYELIGIVSPFRNRVYPCGASSVTLPAGCATVTATTGAHNDSTVGGGVGFTARLPLVANKLDFIAHGLAGDGVGRYNSAQLADLTARPDGTLVPIRNAGYETGFEAHPNAKLDIYGYYGGEYAQRTSYVFTNAAGLPVAVGYGSPLFNNSGCSIETAPAGGGPAGSGFPSGGGACAGDVHQINEATLGFWHRFYDGAKGRVQWGIQYSYLSKAGWSGNNGSGVATPGVSQRPHAVNNIVWTSFRYFLP